MSSANEFGGNISLSVRVLRETYKNINLLLNEMDVIGKEQGFIPLNPKFLRWKSDSYEDGWLLSNFIKVYQMEGGSAGNEMVQDLRDGDVFVVEIDLEGEEAYPEITLSRFQYDLTKWERMPAISDHWLFHDPYRLDNHFSIEETDGLWRCKTKEKSIHRYWGLKQAIGKTIPLTTVCDSASIKTNIFESLLKLPE
ncbi:MULTISPECIES: hypothetical protein [Paenibacillus]|uniref:hypothetical protein n=1 Tax=Paenibacillus TaxID=44249 RepID=UPI001C10B564|nr:MULTISPECIES: hypothetical protein [Paenibacillus]MBS5913914.1 hypothetical protein [Paenibacillus macerans]MBU5444273.1 hypothetical protein [Paenibacillus sp. MSJ-34]MDU5946099.1 hypothetical protein [Paenibacillus macerans]CAH0121002.1 hypothetical protein PAE9249_03527 [Paenibacillus sp. CECT 9249]